MLFAKKESPVSDYFLAIVDLVGIIIKTQEKLPDRIANEIRFLVYIVTSTLRFFFDVRLMSD